MDIYTVIGGSNCTLRINLHRFVWFLIGRRQIDERPPDDYTYDINGNSFNEYLHWQSRVVCRIQKNRTAQKVTRISVVIFDGFEAYFGMSKNRSLSSFFLYLRSNNTRHSTNKFVWKLWCGTKSTGSSRVATKNLGDRKKRYYIHLLDALDQRRKGRFSFVWRPKEQRIM